jgi:hypothetical protein
MNRFVISVLLGVLLSSNSGYALEMRSAGSDVLIALDLEFGEVTAEKGLEGDRRHRLSVNAQKPGRVAEDSACYSQGLF